MSKLVVTYLGLSILILGLLLAFGNNGTASPKDTLLLTRKNTVSLALPITGSSVADIETELLQKDAGLSYGKPLYLVLNSPGGSVSDGLNLIELAKGLGRPVHTISMFSASMSFIISQYLGTRYALDNSVLMSHHAYLSGLEGFVPGSSQSRLQLFVDEQNRISQHIADRSGMTLASYFGLIQNELWMTSDEALHYHFIDSIIKAKCDASLAGYGPPQTIQVMFFTATVQFANCPLITEPRLVSGDNRLFTLMFDNKAEFIREYITTGLIGVK